MKRNFLHKLGDALNAFKGTPAIVDNAPTPKSKSKISIGDIPNKRVSEPSWDLSGNLMSLEERFRVVNHDFMVEIIPIIRKMVKANPNISQALNNIVTLGNTGHKIYFDPNVSPQQVDRMRRHLMNRQREWAPGQPNMNGVVNKMLSQAMIGGALSNEWVPERNLDGIKNIVFVNPEDVRFVLDRDRVTYKPHQQLKSFKGKKKDLIALNPNTYKYFALNGDTELPYGYPPYISALDRVITQQNMLTNIDYIIDTVGLLGFMSALMEKPDQAGMSDEEYTTYLDTELSKMKEAVKAGFKTGSLVGYKEDVEFDFHNISGRDIQGVMELFKNNEMQMFSALKSDPTLAGRDYNTSETQITVIFMKLLSEMKNIQNIVSANLEFGYSLDLRLAGFNFEYLTVIFNRSTLQDDLKFHQAEEIKVRNVQAKYILGIITQEQMADELGYEAPAEKQPRVPVENLVNQTSPEQEAAKGEARQDQKNKSAKKTRDKNKPQGSKK